MKFRTVFIVAIGVLLVGGAVVITPRSDPSTTPVVSEGDRPPEIGPLALIANDYNNMVNALGCSSHGPFPAGAGSSCSVLFSTMNVPGFTVDATDSIVCTLQAPWAPKSECSSDTSFVRISTLAHPSQPCESEHFATLVITDSVTNDTLTVTVKGTAGTTLHCGAVLDYADSILGECVESLTPTPTISYPTVFTAADIAGVPGGVAIATANLVETIDPQLGNTSTLTSLTLESGTVAANQIWDVLGPDNCGGPFGIGYIVFGTLSNGETYSVARPL